MEGFGRWRGSQRRWRVSQQREGTHRIEDCRGIDDRGAREFAIKD